MPKSRSERLRLRSATAIKAGSFFWGKMLRNLELVRLSFVLYRVYLEEALRGFCILTPNKHTHTHTPVRSFTGVTVGWPTWGTPLECINGSPCTYIFVCAVLYEKNRDTTLMYYIYYNTTMFLLYYTCMNNYLAIWSRLHVIQRSPIRFIYMYIYIQLRFPFENLWSVWICKPIWKASAYNVNLS